MAYPRQGLLRIFLLIVALSLITQPVSAGSGFWDEEIKNATGVCSYRTFYNLPDIIVTNSSQLVEVTFKVLQLGGTTYAVKTQSIEMQVDAKSATRKFAIANEVRELKTNDTWGPIEFRFTIMDKDFGLNPQEALTAKITITVNFKEIWGGGEWDHSTKKADVNSELRSSTVPTAMDWLGAFLALIAPYLVPISIGLVIVVTVVVVIQIKIPVGGRSRR